MLSKNTRHKFILSASMLLPLLEGAASLIFAKSAVIKSATRAFFLGIMLVIFATNVHANICWCNNISNISAQISASDDTAPLLSAIYSPFSTTTSSTTNSNDLQSCANQNSNVCCADANASSGGANSGWTNYGAPQSCNNSLDCKTFCTSKSENMPISSPN